MTTKTLMEEHREDVIDRLDTAIDALFRTDPDEAERLRAVRHSIIAGKLCDAVAAYDIATVNGGYPGMLLYRSDNWRIFLAREYVEQTVTILIYWYDSCRASRATQGLDLFAIEKIAFDLLASAQHDVRRQPKEAK